MIPLRAAFSLPTAVNAESYWLIILLMLVLFRK